MSDSILFSKPTLLVKNNGETKTMQTIEIKKETKTPLYDEGMVELEVGLHIHRNKGEMGIVSIKSVGGGRKPLSSKTSLDVSSIRLVVCCFLSLKSQILRTITRVTVTAMPVNLATSQSSLYKKIGIVTKAIKNTISQLRKPKESWRITLSSYRLSIYR